MFLAARLECVARPRLEAGLGEIDATMELRAILKEWRQARAEVIEFRARPMFPTAECKNQ
jgi:hypothetical protein